MKKMNILLTATIAIIITLSGCKKYFDPPLVFEEEPRPNLTKDRKVLLISVDGLSGIELKDNVPPHMANLLEHAKYTFDGIADGDTGDAATWTTMLSGLNSVKHGISGNVFDRDIGDPDNPVHEPTGSEEGFVPVFQRLLETGKLLRSLSITSWPLLYENLFPLSDQRVLAQSDEQAKQIAIDSLKSNDDGLSFCVVNFRRVNDAGLAGGFALENAAYRAALEEVDGHIGEIIEAVQARENYENEDWLIILTANHAGTGSTYGGGTLEERKIPIVFYNRNFQPLELVTPDLGIFARLTGPWSAPVRASIPSEKASAFNFGTTGEYTVQLKINLKNSGSTWPGFFGKRKSANQNNGEAGWAFMFYEAGDEPLWGLLVGHPSAAYARVQNRGVKKEIWTTLTMKIYEENGKRYAQCFSDGDQHADLDITDRNLDNNEPFTIGGMAGWISNTATFDVSDIRVYNVALPDEYITSTYCHSGTDKEDVHYKNLIGYWPVKEGSGTILEDVVGDADFIFERSAAWSIAESRICSPPAPSEVDTLSRQLVVNQVDVIRQVFYWLDIDPHDSWKLEGTVFLDAYEREFVGAE